MIIHYKELNEILLGKKKPLKYLYNDIKKEVNSGRTSLQTLVDELVEYSKYYINIKNPDQRTPAYKDIEDLTEMGVKQHYPLLLNH